MQRTASGLAVFADPVVTGVFRQTPNNSFYRDIAGSKGNYRRLLDGLTEKEQLAFRVSLGAEWRKLLKKRIEWGSAEEASSSSNEPPTGDACEADGSLHALVDSFIDRNSKVDEIDPEAVNFCQTLELRALTEPFSHIWVQGVAFELVAVRRVLTNQSRVQVSDAALIGVGLGLIRCATEIFQKLFWIEFNSQRSGAELAGYHFAKEEARASRDEAYYLFVHRCKAQGLRQLCSKYPVAATFLGILLRNWKASTIELFTRITADRALLWSKFRIPCSALIKSVETHRGDPHLGLRTVSKVEFDSGRDCKSIRIIYKPRSVAIEEAYNDLVRHLTKLPDFTSLPVIQVLDQGAYGYTEYCERQICDPNNLGKFYFQSGRLLAVLHLLGGSDCHYENIIATPNGPCLIDPETLFEARIKDHIGEASTFAMPPSATRQLLDESVLRTGFLPYWIFEGEKSTAVDISALGVAVPKRAVESVFGWMFPNTNGMMPGYTNVIVEVPNSLPYDSGQENLLEVYVKQIADGFRRQMVSISDQQDLWIGSSGVLLKFLGVQKRIVHRTTRVYETLRQGLFEPEILESDVICAAHVEKLSRAYLLSDRRPTNFCLLQSEITQLLGLDIPIFSARVGGKSLSVPSAYADLPNYFAEDGLSACITRIKCMTKDSIEFQVSLIEGAVKARRLSINSLAYGVTKRVALAGISTPKASVGPKTADDRRREALRIASGVLGSSIVGPDGQRDWIGVDVGQDFDKFNFGTIGGSLYSGTLGIAVFLSSCRAGFDPAVSQIASPISSLFNECTDSQLDRWVRDQPSGLLGVGGVLLALIELSGKATDTKQEIAEAARRIVGAATKREIGDLPALDVLSGFSGLIGSLLKFDSESARSFASRVGEHIVARQNADGSWDYPGGHYPLTGFSHGSSGIISALGVLYKETGDSRFVRSVLHGLDFERSAFSEHRRNWPDRRFSGTDDSFYCGWCHGAPGIALSRLILSRVSLTAVDICKELEIALSITSNESCFMDHVCCGRYGRSAILRECGWVREAENLESSCAGTSGEKSFDYSLVANVDGSVAVPGLFTGLSGIGMSLAAPSTLVHVLSAGLLPRQGQL